MLSKIGGTTWQTRKMNYFVKNDIIELGRGKIISHIDMEQIPGEYPVYSSSATNNGQIGSYGKYMFDEELITWSVDGGGRFFYRPKHKFSVTNVSGYLRIRTDALDYRYLYYLLDLQHSHITFDYTYKAHPSVIVNLYEVYDLPLSEQRRIAEILDAADEAIRQTERVIAKLRQVKAGLLHDLLTRGLDAQGRLRDPVAHPEQFKDSPLGRIPREWEVKHLTEELSFPTGQVDPKQEPYRGWPLIAPDHIESVTGRLLAIQTAAEQNAISGKYAFEPGDVLYSKIRPYLRKAVLADCVGLCSADMYPLRPSSGLDSRFLLALILGEDFSRFASAVSMRSGFPKINREEFGEYETVLPPFEEQRCIAATLDAADARIRAEEATLAKLRQVKRGLMDDLLTGRVRVL